MRRAWALALGLSVACGTPPIEDRELVFSGGEPWPERTRLPAPTAPRIALTNAGSDTLSILDATSYATLATVPVGFLPIEIEGPHHLEASRDGRFLYVGISNYVVPAAAASGPHGSHGTGTADGYLLRIDARTGQEVGRARVRRNPGDVRLHPDGRTVFQSHFDVQGVLEAVRKNLPRSELDSVLVGTDAETMQRTLEVRICSAGHGIGFSPSGDSVYVTCWMSDELAVVDLASRSVARVVLGPLASTPPAPRYQPYALTVSPVDGRVFIGTTGPGVHGLEVYDPATRAMVAEARVATAGAPQFGRFTRDGAKLFVVTQRPDRLLVVRPTDSVIVQDRDLAPLGCLNAHLATLSPDESTLWVVCEGNHVNVPGTFHALSADALEPVAEKVSLGLYPDDLAFLPVPSEAEL